MNQNRPTPPPPAPPAGTGARPAPSFFASVAPPSQALPPSPPPEAPRGRVLVAIILLAAALIALIFPASASALTSTGHGVGHLWKGDNLSWLGTYRLADNRTAFCLEAGKSSPVGNDYDLSTGANSLGLSKVDIARLAYISRKWAATTVPNTAAAAQLAVWTITGLNGHTQYYYAGRANEQREAVLALTKSMLDEATAQATLSAASSLAIRLDADGTGTVRGDLTKTLASGSTVAVAAGSYSGTVELTGASFDDGSTSRSVKNGQSSTIRATGADPTVTAKATIRFSGLPFDALITVGSSGAGSQMLLFDTKPAGTSSSASTTTNVSPKPFQPRVQTQTSDKVAEAGASISDALHVDVAAGEGLLGEWGVYAAEAKYLPVPVTVRSTLLGPFATLPEQSAEWPASPPVVCTVATVVKSGPGDYRTPVCTLPSGGYYVWVETIDPADTPEGQGRDRVRPWKSPFAAATEVTAATITPKVSTSVEKSTVSPGECVADTLTTSGLGAKELGIAADVESILVGPFVDAPADGHDFRSQADLASLPIAGQATTRVVADGEYETPCITVTKPGHYVFVFLSEGSDVQSDGSQTIPAFSDLVVHDSERFEVVKPDVPTPPDKPHTVKKVLPKTLAYTGSTGVEPTVLAAVGALSVGLAAVLGTVIARLVRRRLDLRASRVVRASRSARP